MSAIDAVLKANAAYVQEFSWGHLPFPPTRKLAIVTCMDARLTGEHVFGLQTGDAHLIRNAGSIILEDALRSLLISPLFPLALHPISTSNGCQGFFFNLHEFRLNSISGT